MRLWSRNTSVFESRRLTKSKSGTGPFSSSPARTLHSASPLLILRAQDEALLGHDRTGPSGRSVGGDLVHEVIVVTRVVVEDYQGLYCGRIGKAHPLFPGGVAPIPMFEVLGVGVGGVVDHHVRAVDQL